MLLYSAKLCFQIGSNKNVFQDKFLLHSNQNIQQRLINAILHQLRNTRRISFWIGYYRGKDMELFVCACLILIFHNYGTEGKLVSMQPAYPASPGNHWLPSRINSIYSHVGPWSGKFRPVMDDLESDEALRFYNFLNYLDGSSYGTGPTGEFESAMDRLAGIMRKQHARQAYARGPKELEAILGKHGNSIKRVLESSTVIVRKGRTFFCTGEVKEPIVDNKIICKDRILLPIAGTSCRDAVKYWHSDLAEAHYCIGAMEYGTPVAVMERGALFCTGDDYSKREYLLACEFYEDQESPTATLLKYYPDDDYS